MSKSSFLKEVLHLQSFSGSQLEELSNKHHINMQTVMSILSINKFEREIIDRCKLRIEKTIFQGNGFVLVKKDRKCCICGKQETYTIQDFDSSRVSKYPTESQYEKRRLNVKKNF